MLYIIYHRVNLFYTHSLGMLGGAGRSSDFQKLVMVDVRDMGRDIPLIRVLYGCKTKLITRAIHDAGNAS